MPRLKRTRDEAELDAPVASNTEPGHDTTLHALRNMWEFASFMQYIQLFGSVVKIEDDFDIEDLETECLRPTPSDKLAHIGLQLLKFVSSHRGLTPELFDEYTRRQYIAKASHRNPFGEEEEPKKFNDFDVFSRLKILHQLSVWTLWNPDRMRGAMPQDEDQLNWRMEPLGWDKEDRSYFVLDDNRLYRRTETLPPPPPPKAKSTRTPKRQAKKSRTRATRSSKRRKIEDSDDDADHQSRASDDDKEEEVLVAEVVDDEPTYGFTSKTWECVAITLEDYQVFVASITRTRDPNEKELRKRIEEEVMPVIEKRAEAMRQKELKRQREIENLQKLATAKRSSRLAGKAEREKQEREEREAEAKRQQDLKMALEQQERQRKIEEGHESRRMTREQRLREREAKRILHMEELARIEEQAQRASSQEVAGDPSTDGAKRVSERRLVSQREQHQKELDRLAEEEENWTFDCAKCGIHGENLDDGTHSVACERCNVWQHSKCHGFSPKQAESDGFHFVCESCKRKEEEAKRPKIPPIKLENPRRSPTTEKKAPNQPDGAERPRSSGLPDYVQRQLDRVEIPVIHRHLDRVEIPLVQHQTPSRHNPPTIDGMGQRNGQVNLPPIAHLKTPSTKPHPPVQTVWQAYTPPARHSPSHGTVPPSQTSGHGSPAQHLQQHHFIHQSAVAAATSQPRNAQSQTPQSSTGIHTSLPNNHDHVMPQSFYQHQQHPAKSLKDSPTLHPSSAAYGLPRDNHQMSNGPASPTKVSANHVALRSPVSQQLPPIRSSPHLAHSPKVVLPPTVPDQRNGGSPVKSSPPPPLLPSPMFHGSPAPPLSFSQYQHPTLHTQQTPSTIGAKLDSQASSITPRREVIGRPGVVSNGQHGSPNGESSPAKKQYDQDSATLPASGLHMESKSSNQATVLASVPTLQAAPPVPQAQSVPIKKLPEVN